MGGNGYFALYLTVCRNLMSVLTCTFPSPPVASTAPLTLWAGLFVLTISYLTSECASFSGAAESSQKELYF